MADQNPIKGSEIDIAAFREALLERSMEDLNNNLGSTKAQREARQDVLNWVFRYEDSDPFSFEICCLETGMNPDVMRNHIQDIVRMNTQAA